MLAGPRDGSDSVEHGNRDAAINRRIFETSLDLILVTDKRGTLLRVSPSAEAILGYPPDQMIGQSAKDFLYADDLDSTRHEMRQARHGRETRNFECRYVHKDGRIVPLWWKGVWSEPEQTYFFIGRDITDQCRLEGELQEARQRDVLIREGIDRIAEGFALYDEADRLAVCNPAYSNVLPGTDPSRMIGQSFEALLREGLAAGAYPDAVGQEEAWLRERVAQHRDGVTVEQHFRDGRWVLVTNRRMSNGWLAALRIDITRLKQAEAALRDSEEAARGLIDSALDAVVQIDANGVVREWNPQAITAFGWSREEALGRHLGELIIPTADREAHEAGLAHFRATGVGRIIGKRLQMRAVRRDGTEMPVELAVTAMHQASGQLFNGFIRDLTQQLAVEAQLRQAQKMEAIGNLTGGMAHDFNNLLGIIIGNLGLVRDLPEDNAELPELVDEALQAAWRGADLTRRLLAFARRQPLQPARTDINELISDTVRLLRPLLGEHIQIDLRLSDRIWPVTADRAQLEASLVNLATNARDAMPRGGRLSITTGNAVLDAAYAASHADVVAGPFAMIEVSDTGCGMSAEIASRIFEPFFTTKEPGKGTGLGLSMVFGFMRQSGGHINVYSEPGTGTTFRLYLPRATEEASAGETHHAPPPARGAGQAVLLVEDNAPMRRVARRQLQELGYRVFEAEHASAALDLLEREAIALLLTDIVMPGGLDGAALAQLALERWPDLKVVLTSGFPEVRTKTSTKLLDELRLLNKPYSKDELARTLGEVLTA